MTAVLAALGRETIWMLTDRRLSYGARRPPIDDGIKVMTLEAMDGTAILGYAGLGATARKTQPSAWMHAALRGRGELTLEQSLGVLTDLATRELPPHIRTLAGGHAVLAPAFLNSGERRMFAIHHQSQPGGRVEFRFNRLELGEGISSPPLTMLSGTGGVFLQEHQGQWLRPLRRLIKLNERGRVSEMAVARHLAGLNHWVHNALRDGTVGARSIVVWRRRVGSRLAGGGHQAFIGSDLDQDYLPLPMVAGGGYDMSEIGKMMREAMSQIEVQVSDPSSIQRVTDYLDANISRISKAPDERLR